MSTRNKISRGSLFLTIGEASGLFARFVRNIIVARMIAQDDMGIGVTFAMVVTFLEMFSNFGFESMIVQAKNGDEPKVQSMTQLLVVTRGFLIGLAIFFAAPLITEFWDIQHTTNAFRVLAFVPAIRGFIHMDVYRLQRNFNFLPYAASRSIPFIITLLAAAPLAYWLNDYRVLLVLALSDVTLDVIVTHAVSKRRYSLMWSREVLKQSLSFGWPMLLGGALLWVTFYGEQSAVGRYFGMTALGLYGVAFQLVMQPSQLMVQVHDKVALSALSNAQNDRKVFLKRHHASAQFTSVVAGCLGIGFIVAGGWVMPLIYGAKYAPAIAFIGWFGSMQAMRLLRDNPTKVSIALGDTFNAVIGNGVRCISIGVAFFLAAYHEQLEMTPYEGMAAVAMTGFGGELVAYFAMLLRIKLKYDIAMHHVLLPFSVLMCGLAAGWVVIKTGIVNGNTYIAPIAMTIMMAAYLGICYVLFIDFRDECRRIFVKLKLRKEPLIQPVEMDPSQIRYKDNAR